MTLRQEDTGAIKYEVRSTKYEVKELGATELRGHGMRRQSRNDVRELNSCTRDAEAPLVRRAGVTRMGTGMAAILENFIGTGAVRHMLCYFVPRIHLRSLVTTLST